MNFHSKTPAAFAAEAPVLAAAVNAHTAADEGATAKPGFPFSLPSWADNDEGRELLAAIIIERPAKRNYDNGCSAWGGWEYVGRNANKLRKLFDRAVKEIADRETALWKAGKDYGRVHQELNALLGGERPDALIKRVLDEPAPMKAAA